MSLLVNCFVCGGQVSRSASVCPHCGEPDFNAKDKETYLLLKALEKKKQRLLEEMARNNEIIREAEEVEKEERDEWRKDILDRLDRLAGDD